MRTCERKIKASPTQFLFTYGRQEHVIYRLEAEEHYSCDFLADCSNVRCESTTTATSFMLT